MRFAGIGLWIGVLLAQVTIHYQEDFNSTPAGGTPPGWSLNTTDLGGSAPPNNYWRVDAVYGLQSVLGGLVSFSVPNQPSMVSGAPQSTFLYITPDNCPVCSPSQPVAFLAGISESSFAKSPSISIPAGTNPVKLSFFWIAEAGGGSYGEVYFREGGGAWQILTSRRGSTQLQQNSSSWYADTITLSLTSRPTTIELGFRFVTGSGGNDPSIAVDEIRVFEETTTPPPAGGIALGTITPSTVCAGGTLNVPYTSGLSGNLTYTAQVFNSSGTIVASASGASPIAITIPNIVPSGTYSVRVAANTNPPTYSDTASITIVNVQSLSCSATPLPAVPGSTVTLTLNGTGLPSGPFTVQFNPGDGSPTQTRNNVNSLPVSFTHTYSSSGSYTATFTITHTASGCTGTCNATVQVGGERIDALALRDSVVCAGDSFYVDYSSVGITFAAGNTFTVEVRDGSGNVITSCATNSNAPSGSLGCRIPVGTAPGSYSVRIRSSNPTYTSNSLSLTVSNPPTADFEPNTNLRFCAGEPITFTDRSQNATRVRWDFGDGTTSTSRNPTHTYTQPGTYTVTLTASIGTSCTASIQRDIEVRPAPQASFTVNPPSLTLPEQNTATFTNTSTGASSYLWDFGNGQTSTAENPTATYDREGEYLVVLTATSPEGCRDTAQYRLRVVFAQGLSIPNAFTPNGDGMNDRYAVRYSGMQTLRVSIYDRWGNLIFTDQRNTPTGIIEWDGTKNGQSVPEGVYAVYLEGKTLDGQNIRRSVAITLLR